VSFGLASTEVWVAVKVPKTTMLPKSVFLIASGELAERYAFYGLSALLPLLLLSWGVGVDHATSLMSMFRAIAYLSPVLGSVVADAFLGKYLTIVLGLSLYVVGMGMATGASLMSTVCSYVTFFLFCVLHLVPFRKRWLFVIALILVALATGGIKSVVAALLGEQVSPDDRDGLDRAFSLFYASINVGSLLTFIITPLIRTHVPMPYSFFAALGSVTFAMLVACCVFSFSKRWYLLKSAGRKELLRFVELCWVAFRSLWRAIRGRVTLIALLEEQSFSREEIRDAQASLAVVKTFVFVFPVYFSVLEQQGSRWVFQLMRMDRTVPFSSLQFPPDSSGIYNPVFVLICVPLVRQWMLGSVAPLKKILIGLFLAACALATSAVLVKSPFF
jgi:dipeptide/tripeptide permease